MSLYNASLSVQELVRYVLVVQDSEKAPLRWGQGTHRSWLPLSPVTLSAPPQQPGPPRLMAAGQPPFQVLSYLNDTDLGLRFL